jgi:protease PrsW
MPVRLDQYKHLLPNENTPPPPQPAPPFQPQPPLPPQPPPPPPPPPRQGLREATRNLGLYNPYVDTGKPKGSLLGTLALLVFAVFGLVLVAALTVFNLGIVAAVVGAVVAVVPASIYLTIFLWLDRYDPEPPGRLIFAFLWGAVVAILISFIVNTTFGLFFGDRATAIISAPIIEESAKGACLLILLFFFRKDFDGVVDGIVYGGVVALGFATVENILYYGSSLNRGGLGGLVGTFVVRGIFRPYGHVMYTCITGIGVGIARETHNMALKIVCPVAGYFVAVFLHSLWNTTSSVGNFGFLLIAYALIQAPLFIALLSVSIYLVRREGRILKESLAAEVMRGLITQSQLDIAVSIFRRAGWVASAFGNSNLFNARRQFLRAVSKLGLCHWHVQRAAKAGAETTSFPLIAQFQAEVFSLRDRIENR